MALPILLAISNDESGFLISINIGLSLAAGLAYGYLLGVFFPRFKRRVVSDLSPSIVTS